MEPRTCVLLVIGSCYRKAVAVCTCACARVLVGVGGYFACVCKGGGGEVCWRRTRETCTPFFWLLLLLLLLLPPRLLLLLQPAALQHRSHVTCC